MKRYGDNASDLQEKVRFKKILNDEISGRIFIYGVGINGKIIIDEINEINPKCIRGGIDQSLEGYVKGVYVTNIKNAEKHIGNEDLVVITISDKEAVEDVVLILKEREIKHMLWLDQPCMIRFYHTYDFINRTDLSAEFYLIDAFEISHFRPIVEYLNDNGIDAHIVSEKPRDNTVGKWFDYDKAINILDKEKIPYTEHANPYAKWAITTQEARVLNKYGHIKINMTYGVSLMEDNFFVSERSIEGFDYKWVHGELQKKRAGEHIDACKIYPIGYPRYSEKFYQRPAPICFCGNKEKKPVALYLPTWDEYSSIGAFGIEIGQLRDAYYVVCKPHHCTARLADKLGDREILESNCDEVLYGYTLDEAVLSADIIIADAKSGSATEAAYINSNSKIILLWPYEDVGQDDSRIFVDEIKQYAPLIKRDEHIRNGIIKTEEYKEKQRFIRYCYGNRGDSLLDNILEIFKR